MAAAMEELFRGRSLFVTGATGFLGKVRPLCSLCVHDSR